MNILIIEDEKLAFNRMKTLLNSMPIEISNLYHTESILDTVEWFSCNTKPDLILMDIELLDGNSFEVFKHVQVDSPIIFTTAYNEFAIDAFKVNSVDYLLKPIKQEELKIAFEKFEKIHASSVTNLVTTFTSTPLKQQFIIKLGQKLKVVPIEDIAYFFSKNKMSYLCTYSGNVLPMHDSLDKIQDDVDAKQFFRLNRQFIAGFKSIKDIQISAKSKVIVTLFPSTNSEVIISAEKSASFKIWLDR